MTTATQLVWPALRFAANHRVSRTRTDAADVARILWDHGVKSTEALNAVENHIRASMPEAAYDKSRAKQLQQSLDELANCGYSEYEYRRKLTRGGRLGGRWSEVAEILKELAEVWRPAELHQAQVEAAVNSWWKLNEGELRTLCRNIAEQFVVGKWNGD